MYVYKLYSKTISNVYISKLLEKQVDLHSLVCWEWTLLRGILTYYVEGEFDNSYQQYI